MSIQLFVVLLLAAVAALYAGLAAITYFRMRGQRVVVCPETREPSIVTVDAAHAAASAIRESADIELASCERWADRPECNQACTAQIAVSPEGTRPWNILAEWYIGKNCALCDHPIGHVHHGQPKPGLVNATSPSHEIVLWEDIPVERLPVLLQSYLPVCANCAVAETFRHQFPDLVLERKGHDQVTVH
jgi:hypothetical protein